MASAASSDPSIIGPRKIAVYWDFENIHNGIQPRGVATHQRANPFRVTGNMVEVKAVLDYLSSLGDVVINRAYANWTMFKNYRFVMLEHSIDLIQLFPRGQHAKNGADIRMAIDALEDIFHFDEIDTQVIIGGDSDFSGVAQKLRQHGKYVIGIGARNSSNIYWIKSCNEFKYYHTLTGSRTRAEDENEEAPPEGELDLDEAKDLLLRATRRLGRNHEEGLVPLYSVRPMMIRMDPSFDESNFGFESFLKFVEDSHDILHVQESPDGPMIRPAARAGEVATPSPENLSKEDLERIYRSVLRQIDYRLMPHAERMQALETLFNLLSEHGPIEDQTAVKEQLLERYTNEGNAITDEDAQHIWDMGYKANVYYFQEYPYRNIVLNERIPSIQAMVRRADLSIVKRLIGKCPVQPLDPEVISDMLYGVTENGRVEYVRELIGEAEAAG
ncbi:NYN domain-containing protein [bacterium]|nr:NYN domain-containing protein [bacterium]